MNTHTHTQGPWQIQFWDYFSRPSRRDTPVITTGKDAIGELYNLWDEDGEAREAERLANARLIAAAPEMLAALQSLTHPMASDEDLSHALAVIAKVKGGDA
jgi:hypothetical protein